MDSKRLRILMAAADLGSLTRAAEAVGYTQSGLTHMMDALEREVGFPLLQRSHNGIQLSEQGAMLMPAIREFLQASDRLESQISAIASEHRELIRVAAYASIAMHWMPELLYRFRRLCPEVGVELRMVDHALEPFEMLESGQADVFKKYSALKRNGKPEEIAALFALLLDERLGFLTGADILMDGGVVASGASGLSK